MDFQVFIQVYGLIQIVICRGGETRLYGTVEQWN